MTRRIPVARQKVRGRKKAVRNSVTMQKLISGTLDRFHFSAPENPIITYRDLCAFLTRKSGHEISLAMTYKLAQGYDPQDPDLRRALHLPVLVKVPVCPKCGTVHPPKRCPTAATPRKPRRLRLSVPGWSMMEMAVYLNKRLTDKQLKELRTWLD